MMKPERQQPPQTQNVPVVTAQVIQPHYNTRVVITEQQPNLTSDMENAYGLSQMLKVLTGFDAVMCIFFAFSSGSFFYLLAFLFAIVGYRGSKKYDSCNIITYGSFVFIETSGKVGICGYLLYENSDEIGGVLFSTILSVLITIWLIRIIYRFNKTIRKLEPEQKLLLQKAKIKRIIFW
jgi:hypothetical protein